MRVALRVLVCACPLALGAGWFLVSHDASGADEPPTNKPLVAHDAEKGDDHAGGQEAAWTTAVTPKRLSPSVLRGLGWLVEHQLPSGGWGQGEESATMRASGSDRLRDEPNVADTCIAALALIRSGSTPSKGQYHEAVARAVRFVATQVEESETQSLAVSKVQGTRVQQKLGPNIDTFLASMLLAEVKGRMPTEAENRRISLALDRVLDKIKRHQKEDGTFDGQGWAPVLSWAMCGKGINRARQAGAHVPAQVLARSENSAKLAFAPAATPSAPAAGLAGEPGGGGLAGGRTPLASTRPVAGAGAAGVELYDKAANLGALQDSVNTNRAAAPELRQKAQSAPTDRERDEAKRELLRIDDAEKVFKDAQQAVIGRLEDKQFVSGFGSNGGEEFLSYMNISESLVVKGGPEWTKWDTSMAENLGRVQNDDGSWSGHHCITGRTFCTSSALLVLMADRTPVPVKVRAEGPKTPE